MKPVIYNLVGAVIGGLAGYFVFVWLWNFGLYGLALPGGLLGLGAGTVKHRSLAWALISGVAALALGLFSEWHNFQKDESLSFFLTHVGDLNSITLIMIGLGAFIGFWVPFRQIEAARPSDPPPKQTPA